VTIGLVQSPCLLTSEFIHSRSVDWPGPPTEISSRLEATTISAASLRLTRYWAIQLPTTEQSSRSLVAAKNISGGIELR